MPNRERLEPIPGSEKYSFCESVHVTGPSPWHIRKLDPAGRMLGGGITTPSLCGRVDRGWDLSVVISIHHLGHSCRACVTAFKRELGLDAKESK